MRLVRADKVVDMDTDRAKQIANLLAIFRDNQNNLRTKIQRAVQKHFDNRKNS